MGVLTCNHQRDTFMRCTTHYVHICNLTTYNSVNTTRLLHAQGALEHRLSTGKNCKKPRRRSTCTTSQDRMKAATRTCCISLAKISISSASIVPLLLCDQPPVRLVLSCRNGGAATQQKQYEKYSIVKNLDQPPDPLYAYCFTPSCNCQLY